MTKNTTFSKDIYRGTLGEEIVESVLKNIFSYNYLKVTEDKKYQNEDVDFILTKKDKEIKIEVKTDSYTTGNMAWEEFSCTELKTPGCFQKTKADFICYYFIEWDLCYVFDTKVLREFVLSNKNSWHLRDFIVTDNGHSKYHSSGYIIPLSLLEEKLPENSYIKIPLKNIGGKEYNKIQKLMKAVY